MSTNANLKIESLSKEAATSYAVATADSSKRASYRKAMRFALATEEAAREADEWLMSEAAASY